MKRFIYFLDNEGGMDTIYVNEGEDVLSWIAFGSMDNPEDVGLLDWMKTAPVGGWCEHRVGCMVRVLDGKPW